MKNIFLIHGWNYTNYTKFGSKDSWQNRIEFVNELAKYFNVVKINLPGFSGEMEPEGVLNWDLDDYANFFEEYRLKTKLRADYVLGYSFGAAIAVNWKNTFPNNSNLILVSPAITRAYQSRKETKFIKKFKILVPLFISTFLRHLYLVYIIKNKFYVEGTQFLRNSYLNIVKIDLSSDLAKLPENELLIIFGENDTATPASKLISKLGNSSIINRVKIINEGGHDIANSHFKEIVKLIKDNFE